MRDFLGIKPIESAPITFPLLQYNRPAQPGLRSFKHEKFKVLAVIVDGDTPLAIMILEHKRIIDTKPRASFNRCGCTVHKDKSSLNFYLTKMLYLSSIKREDGTRIFAKHRIFAG